MAVRTWVGGGGGWKGGDFVLLLLFGKGGRGGRREGGPGVGTGHNPGKAANDLNPTCLQRDAGLPSVGWFLASRRQAESGRQTGPVNQTMACGAEPPVRLSVLPGPQAMCLPFCAPSPQPPPQHHQGLYSAWAWRLACQVQQLPATGGGGYAWALGGARRCFRRGAKVVGSQGR